MAKWINPFFPTAVLILMLPAAGIARRLSQEEVYIRCHSQMMKKRPSQSDPIFAQIKARTITATQACVGLAEKGLLNPATGTLQND
ncbi:MAG: hypothetical protein K2X47_10590, partial [Bdellovibrionales bacterium]|nr:hypothetical protein [Bdellovibrionales bacterium]